VAPEEVIGHLGAAGFTLERQALEWTAGFMVMLRK
jgi:hypothetical protein